MTSPCHWCHGAPVATAASLHPTAGPRTPAIRVLLRRRRQRGRESGRHQLLVSGGSVRWREPRSPAAPPSSLSRFSVTDAAELWSTCFTPDSLAALVGNRTAGQSLVPRACPNVEVGSGHPFPCSIDLVQTSSPPPSSHTPLLWSGKWGCVQGLWGGAASEGPCAL